jgi:hypothetical protein
MAYSDLFVLQLADACGARSSWDDGIRQVPRSHKVTALRVLLSTTNTPGADLVSSQLDAPVLSDDTIDTLGGVSK